MLNIILTHTNFESIDRTKPIPRKAKESEPAAVPTIPAATPAAIPPPESLFYLRFG